VLWLQVITTSPAYLALCATTGSAHMQVSTAAAQYSDGSHELFTAPSTDSAADDGGFRKKVRLRELRADLLFYAIRDVHGTCWAGSCTAEEHSVHGSHRRRSCLSLTVRRGGSLGLQCPFSDPLRVMLRHTGTAAQAVLRPGARRVRQVRRRAATDGGRSCAGRCGRRLQVRRRRGARGGDAPAFDR